MHDWKVTAVVNTTDNPASLVWRIEEALGRAGLAPTAVQVTATSSIDWPGAWEQQR